MNLLNIKMLKKSEFESERRGTEQVWPLSLFTLAL